MANTFTNTFGGSAVSPADVAYAGYSFASDLVLFWPAFSYGQTNVAARFMNLTATASGLNVFMPDALLTSVGQDVIIFNEGSETFNVLDFGGGAIATIAPGQTYYILLNDNTSQAGGWQTVQFGVGTGSADAASLAGAGLLAIGPLLNVNLMGTTITNPATITSAARAVLQIWTGGTGTVELPTAASVGDGFFFPFSNQGNGTATIVATGGDTIDGAATSVFTQTLSGFIVSSGGAWYTVGKGSQTNFAVTILNLNVAGSDDVTESSTQAQNIIQQFTGILTGNINIIVPATAQIYFVYNDTTGPYSLTFKTALGSGITIDQGSHVILYCDGTNIVNAFTSTFGGAISISAGSAGAPNFNFIGSSTTGIYSPAVNQIAVTAGGHEVMNFTSEASAVNFIQATASATGSAIKLVALGTDTNIPITLSGKGTGTVGIAQAAITGGAIDGTVIGGVTPSAITGTTIVANGGFTGNLTGTAPAGTLTGTTLASNVVTSSLTAVGTLVTGVWNGTPIDTSYGGTGQDTHTSSGVAQVLSGTWSVSTALANNTTATTQSANDNSTKVATTAYIDKLTGSVIANSLASDVALNNSSIFFDGPSIAQGATGTWFVSGTITLFTNNYGADTFTVKLWDGTTVIASTSLALPGVSSSGYFTVSLSGFMASPAANLRISVKSSGTSNRIVYNQSGLAKDSTITAFRVA